MRANNDSGFARTVAREPLTILTPIVRPLMRWGIAQRAAQFAELPPSPGRVVFLGDSITQQGVWDEWFPELRCLRRGIGGDSVGGVQRRLSERAPRSGRGVAARRNQRPLRAR